MKVRFPLWLKVSTWLVANLALLGAVGAGLFYAQLRSGQSFLTGKASERVEVVSNIIRRELQLNPTRDRDELLANYSENYGVEFLIVSLNGEHIAGPDMTVPAEVLNRIKELSPQSRFQAEEAILAAAGAVPAARADSRAAEDRTDFPVAGGAAKGDGDLPRPATGLPSPHQPAAAHRPT